MFGYVKVYKPELKIKHYEAYKGIYCSVCRTLGKDYGLFARMTLSYDVTMLALTRLCARSEKLCFENKRCPFNPSKKCNFCTVSDEEFSYAAGVGVMLTYYKLKDNIRDDGFFGKLIALLLMLFLIRPAKKAIRKYGETAEIISTAMEKQNALETAECGSTDEAADPVAFMLSVIFSSGFDENEKLILSRLGYCVGRFIYIADACDDIEKDLKKNRFNVLVNANGLKKGDTEAIKRVREKTKGSLFVCAAEAARAFELMKENGLSPVCENIIYEGLYNTAQVICERKKTNEKSL